MEMTELEKVIRGLRDIDMFIAGRLEHEKAKNFLRTIDETIALLKEQEPVAVYESKISRCACGNTVNRYWHPKFCGYCGKELMWY